MTGKSAPIQNWSHWLLTWTMPARCKGGSIVSLLNDWSPALTVRTPLLKPDPTQQGLTGRPSTVEAVHKRVERHLVPRWTRIASYPAHHTRRIMTMEAVVHGLCHSGISGNGWKKRDWAIATKELIHITLGCAVWGHEWAGHCINGTVTTNLSLVALNPEWIEIHF